MDHAVDPQTYSNYVAMLNTELAKDKARDPSRDLTFREQYIAIHENLSQAYASYETCRLRDEILSPFDLFQTVSNLLDTSPAFRDFLTSRFALVLGLTSLFSPLSSSSG